MDPSVEQTLEKMVLDGNGLTENYQAARWSGRVKSFLTTALGSDAATDFAELQDDNPFDELAMRIGYLEGLIAKSKVSQSEPLAARTSNLQFDSRKLFVVHGHDVAAKESLARFLQKVKLEPIILHEQPNGGRTIIEKFETYSSDVGFAVVLLTPDDMGCAANDVKAEKLKPRARQNVITELGFFIGKLGRTRVCALHKGEVELPSDYSGVLYLPMDESDAWKTKLAQELVEAKMSIDIAGLLAT